MIKRWIAIGLITTSGILAQEPPASPTGKPAPTLDRRLNEQWRKFDEARALALTQTVSRALWEKTLALSPPLSDTELSTLRDRQDAAADAVRRRNQTRSSLNLEILRKGKFSRIQQFCADFPKGGMLHVHAWGTVSESAMAELFQRLNPIIHPGDLHRELLPQTDWHTDLMTGRAILYPGELAFLSQLGSRYGTQFKYHAMGKTDQARLRALLFLKSGSHPFPRFEGVFTLLIRLILSQPATIRDPIMYDDFFSRAHAQKLSYVEIIDPLSDVQANLGGLEAWASEAENRYSIIARMQAAFLRASPADVLAKQVGLLLALAPSPILVGVNTVSNEDGNPALEKGQPTYIPLLRAAEEKRTLLHRAMHAGEGGDLRNVRDALILGAERIGHGVALRRDPVTLEFASTHHVALEACLTSNVRLGVVPSYREHPFLYFLRLGMRVSLATDDEGIFATDIDQECTHAIAESDMNYEELRQLAWNSLDTAFVGLAQKKALERRLNKQLAVFEKKWKAVLH